MKVFSGKHEGDFALNEDIRISGMVVGNVVVPCGVFLVLSGVVTGTLTVEAGGKAEVRGIVHKAVYNDGGDIEIFGIVGGLGGSGDANTIVHVGAIVHK